MSAYSLAIDCKLEGRVRTPLAELVEYYRNKEDYELFLLKQEKDTKMINKLNKDLEGLGYSLDERNSCIDFVEKKVNFPSSQLNTEDEVFTCVDISSDEELDLDNGVIRTTVYMTFETKDGRWFDVEMTQENEAVKETDSGFLDGYYPGKRTFLDIQIKK